VARVPGILNAVAMDHRLLTAGQPTAGELSALAAAGDEAVIRLSTLESGLADEAEVVRRLGLDYRHIPVVWTAPARADLDAFVAAMDAWQGRRLLVHCVKNYRVSVFVGLYLLGRGAMDAAQVRAHVQGVFEPNEVWIAFLETELRRLGG